MTDTLSKAERSRNMAKIRATNTGPERQVRSLLHRAGYRFRLHVKDLPGKPDIVLPRYGAVIFVHGCFWHRHKGCKDAATPKSHRKFWMDKFARNVANDKKHVRRLRRLGWRVIVVWECRLRNPQAVLHRIEKSLNTP
ncbi:MAG: DNA mismatch endonuclease Vsr [Clostridiaceae bacterium]|nr:DNA mismatch endonuclease Vsr [Clostridiaceae bacterium]